MGLDMMAFKVQKGVITEQVDFQVAENEDSAVEFHYWRKHPNLHGWMENLYYEKGGTADDFNCVNVQLTEDDLDDLEAAVQGRELPETRGFFFGESDGSETQGDLEFIRDARQAISEGYDVFYTSWW